MAPGDFLRDFGRLGPPPQLVTNPLDPQNIARLYSSSTEIECPPR